MPDFSRGKSEKNSLNDTKAFCFLKKQGEMIPFSPEQKQFCYEMFLQIFIKNRYQSHFTVGGREERMLLILPPVFKPKIVPRS